MYATMAEVRVEYVMALWDVLEGYQRLWNEEEMAFLRTRPDLMDNPTLYPIPQEFMNELFDWCQCEWVHANTFRLYTNVHEGVRFAIDDRVSEIMQAPDTAWSSASFTLGEYDGEPCLAVEVDVVDSADDLL